MPACRHLARRHAEHVRRVAALMLQLLPLVHSSRCAHIRIAMVPRLLSISYFETEEQHQQLLVLHSFVMNNEYIDTSF